MTTPSPPTRSPAPFENTPPSVLAIACLDGRFFPHVAGFLRGFGAGVDALMVPGGVGSLTPARCGDPAGEALDLGHVETMVDLHPIDTIVLVGHADCGFYALQMPEASPEARFAAQREDLVAFEDALRARYPAVDVQRWYAFTRGSEVVFDRP